MPSDFYSLDYESTSLCDIKLGAYRYAADPSTRILMFAIAKNDNPPVAWNFIDGNKGEGMIALHDLRRAIETGGRIYSHNAGFEIPMSHYRMVTDLGVEPPPLEVWRCTKAMALRAAIPASLAGASDFLKLSDKDKRGKALIGVFSDQRHLTTLSNGKQRMKVPSPILCDPIPWDWTVTVAGEHHTVRKAWEMFIDYCRQDVVVEQQIHKKLAKFELTGTELDGFLFDLRMNHRGIPVNVPALRHAKTIVDEHAAALTQEFLALTGLMPSQNKKVKEWLQARGYKGDSLDLESREKYAADLEDPDAKMALHLAGQLSFAAVKKVDAMLDTTCPDDRMRGLFTWHGAQRTGRWTSSGPQMQNAKKPSIKQPDEAYKYLCEGACIDTLRQFYGNPYEVIASVIRNFVKPHSGMMLDADYSNIESRVASWLVGCDGELQMYRDGRDIYKDMASTIFNTPYDEVSKEQRFVGKVAILSCCFQTSAQKLHETCAAWGQPVSKEVAIQAVKTFRGSKPQYPDAWKAYGSAISKAIKAPGEWFDASPYVKFGRTLKEPFDRLIMRLPSGRDIIYPYPQIQRKVTRNKDFETGEWREWETDEITFYGQGKVGVNWMRVATYPASCFQSSVQGTARDFMLYGCLQAEKAGFDIFALIHDQALAEDGDPDKFVEALCTLPPWVPKDFPLAAAGGRVPYYAKD
jgi:DNA polymerase